MPGFTNAHMHFMDVRPVAYRSTRRPTIFTRFCFHLWGADSTDDEAVALQRLIPAITAVR